MRKQITVYIGCWNGEPYVYSLDGGKVVEQVKSTYAYGEPSDDEDEYALGNTWKSDDCPFGWEILEREMDVETVNVEINGVIGKETCHLNWCCPNTGKYLSEDWVASSELPTLLICECCKPRQFFLGDVLQF